MRTEFGLSRTTCSCRECSHYCHSMPGFLVPSDLGRLSGIDPAQDFPRLVVWARNHLLASPGAVVYKEGIGWFRIPTLVPRRQPDNQTCHWLMEDGRCSVHKDAPYGCAFCDSHTSLERGHLISASGLHAICQDIANDGPYLRLWTILEKDGLTAPGPEESRKEKV